MFSLEIQRPFQVCGSWSYARGGQSASHKDTRLELPSKTRGIEGCLRILQIVGGKLTIKLVFIMFLEFMKNSKKTV